jgi:hypothetical protein
MCINWLFIVEKKTNPITQRGGLKCQASALLILQVVLEFPLMKGIWSFDDSHPYRNFSIVRLGVNLD